MSDYVERALAFATKAHAGQVRKYTGEPYINHPIEVADIVRTVTDNCDMIAAALLHDVVEDCDVTNRDLLEAGFNPTTIILVTMLTDVSRPQDGNRARRKEIDRQHLAQAHPAAKTIKLADLISNTKSICERDRDFAQVYMREKEALLEVLVEGDSRLMKRCQAIVTAWRYGK